jgi:hypothetical protein
VESEETASTSEHTAGAGGTPAEDGASERCSAGWYADAVIAGLPPDDEVVQLASLASARGTTLEVGSGVGTTDHLRGVIPWKSASLV